MIPADMLIDWAVIWAVARIASMNQALWIPLVVLGPAGIGVLVTAMVLVRLEVNRVECASCPESRGPYYLITVVVPDLMQWAGRQERFTPPGVSGGVMTASRVYQVGT